MPKFYEVENSGHIARKNNVKQNQVKAIFSGQKRKPLKGEYFLSGAIPTAYLAPNNLNTVYHIAKIVLVEYITTINIIKEL